MDFKPPPPHRLLPEAGGKLGFDELEHCGEKRRDGVHKKSVHMNQARVKAVISGRLRAVAAPENLAGLQAWLRRLAQDGHDSHLE